MENVNINLAPSTEELTLRTGTAPEPIQNISVRVTGNIEAPAKWVQTKEADIDGYKAFVTVNRNSFNIVLTLNADQENFRLRNTITGQISIGKKLGEFGINTSKKFELNDLANLLKFNRRFFVSPQAAMEVVAGLKAFKAQVNRQIEAVQDDRGNSRRLQDKQVHNSLPETFTLKMPVIEGDGLATFDVELCIEEKEGIVRAFLQSVSLEEIMETRINELIEAQLPVFEKAGITVIFDN